MKQTDIFDGCKTSADAISVLCDQNVEFVRIGVFDADAIFREKMYERDKAIELIENGSSFSNVLYKWDTGEATCGGGTYEDEVIKIDPTSGRQYPFAENAAIFVADYDGPHRKLSPRNLALEQIRRAEALGYGVRVGIEYEFSLFEETPQSLRDKGYRDLRSFVIGNQAYSGLTTAIKDDFIMGLFREMSVAGIPFDSFHTELGPGSFEVPLAAEVGIRAVDNAAFFKAFTKAYCQRHGCIATFMAKWSNDWPGQSGHMHLSLFDLETGQPVFMNENDGTKPNNLLRWFIGGVIRQLPFELAMYAHTANAYRRMIPGSWAPTHASWGVENRSCAVRAITFPAPASRLELRVPAADSNPYLAIAACLATGLSGIEEHIDPPMETTGDAYEETIDDLRRFPRTLLEAAERFRHNKIARQNYGDTFVDWFAESRAREDQVFREHVSDLDVQRYFEVI